MGYPGELADCVPDLLPATCPRTGDLPQFAAVLLGVPAAIRGGQQPGRGRKEPACRWRYAAGQLMLRVQGARGTSPVGLDSEGQDAVEVKGEVDSEVVGLVEVADEGGGGEVAGEGEAAVTVAGEVAVAGQVSREREVAGEDEGEVAVQSRTRSRSRTRSSSRARRRAR